MEPSKLARLIKEVKRNLDDSLRILESGTEITYQEVKSAAGQAQHAATSLHVLTGMLHEIPKE